MSLSAYIQGESILIELQDDGRGLNFEVLREWVMRKYMLSNQEGNFLTEDEILDYLFRRKHQANSGVQDIEDIGLSSVQGTLETLNGSIGVSAVMTRGTTFRITLPNLILAEPKLNWHESSRSALDPLTTSNGPSAYPTVSMDYSLDSLRLQKQSGPSLQLDTQGLFIWADQMSVFFLECNRIEEYVMPHVTEAHEHLTVLSWRDQSIPIFSLQDFIGDGMLDAAPIEDDVILVLKGEATVFSLASPDAAFGECCRLEHQSFESSPCSSALHLWHHRH